MKKNTVFLSMLISLISGSIYLNTAQSSGFIYTRTPSGSTVISPVSLRIQGVFGLDFCTNSSAVSYELQIGSHIFHTQGEAVDDTLAFNLSTGDYQYISLECYAADSSIHPISNTILEYIPGGVIFEVVPVIISTQNLPDATVGELYSQILQAFGGIAPLTWSISSGLLPSGLALNLSTGEIFGTSTTLETANFTIQVTDADNQIAAKNLSITVHGNTPVGSNISVISGSITLTFSNVTQEGQTTVTQSSSGFQPPSGFKLGNPPTYYSISTTAQFSGQVEVCLTWTQGQFNNENNLKLFHYNGINWTNITEAGYPDTVNNIICGLTTSFSDFAIFEKKQVEVNIDIKPGSYPNTINLGSNGTVPVAIFSTPTFDARTVDPLTVTLASAPVQLRGNGTVMYSLQDVNNDGLLDMVVHVNTEALQLSSNDEVANLVGYTSDQIEVVGNDTVRIIQ